MTKGVFAFYDKQKQVFTLVRIPRAVFFGLVYFKMIIVYDLQRRVICRTLSQENRVEQIRKKAVKFRETGCC